MPHFFLYNPALCIFCQDRIACYAEDITALDTKNSALNRALFIASSRLGEYIQKVELLERANRQLSSALLAIAEVHNYAERTP